MVMKDTSIEDDMEEDGHQPAIADSVGGILDTLVTDVVYNDN